MLETVYEEQRTHWITDDMTSKEKKKMLLNNVGNLKVEIINLVFPVVFEYGPQTLSPSSLR
jgi:hypothetical protein